MLPPSHPYEVEISVLLYNLFHQSRLLNQNHGFAAEIGEMMTTSGNLQYDLLSVITQIKKMRIFSLKILHYFIKGHSFTLFEVNVINY